MIKYGLVLNMLNVLFIIPILQLEASYRPNLKLPVVKVFSSIEHKKAVKTSG